MSESKTVFIVDDDPGVRDSLALLLGLEGLSVQSFADAEGFLSVCQPCWRGCILIDIRLGNIGGLELQAILRSRGMMLPIIIMTAHASVATARVAFKAGAVDFLTKPIPTSELLAAIGEAMGGMGGVDKAPKQHPADVEIEAGQLTQRENEVLMLIYRGMTTREIAERLIISPRTVETYKARMMKKLNARRVAELIRYAAEKRPSIGVS